MFWQHVYDACKFVNISIYLSYRSRDLPPFVESKVHCRCGVSPVLKIPAFDETPIRLVFREKQREHMDQAAGHRRASHGPRTAFPASIEQEAWVMMKVILFALSTRVFLIL